MIYDDQYELDSRLYFAKNLGVDENLEEKPKQKQSQDHGKKDMPKASISNAIMDILGTEEKEDDKDDKDCVILSKNSRPFKLLEQEKKKLKEQKSKILQRDIIRKQGRRFPNTKEHDYEKNLQMIATKGVVRLFNAVSHQQTEIRREAVKDEKIREDFVAKKLEMDKSKHNSNKTILDKIQSKEKRWKAFEDDEEGEGMDQ